MLQPAAAADADGLAPDVPLQAGDDVKPVRLCSPQMVEPQPASRCEPEEEEEEERTALKQEPGVEDSQEGLVQGALVSLCDRTASPPADRGISPGLQGLPIAPMMPGGEEDQGNGCDMKVEDVAILSCRAPTCPSPLDTPQGDDKLLGCYTKSPACSPTLHMPAQLGSVPEDASLGTLDANVPFCDGPLLLHQQPSSASPLDITTEDPMAGMIALVAASELPQAMPSQAGTALLEPGALQGMALLSDMAALELERQQGDDQGEVHLRR